MPMAIRTRCPTNKKTYFSLPIFFIHADDVLVKNKYTTRSYYTRIIKLIMYDMHETRIL